MKSKSGTFFECKVRYEKMGDDGFSRKVTDTYVVDAVSWTEAEQRITSEAESFVNAELEIKEIKKAAYKEVLLVDGSDEEGSCDMWFRCKLAFISINEKTQSEKQTSVVYLVQAGSMEHAYRNIRDYMDSTMIDYVIKSVQETPILDVFIYKEKKAKDNNEV